MFAGAAILSACSDGALDEESSDVAPTNTSIPTPSDVPASATPAPSDSTPVEADDSTEDADARPQPFDVAATTEAVDALGVATSARVVIGRAAGVLVIRADGAIVEIPITATTWPVSDGRFVYLTIYDNEAPVSEVWTLTGDRMCTVDGWVHHAVTNDVAEVIAAVEAPNAEEEWANGNPRPTNAINCSTGESQPIEPFRGQSEDGELVSIERVGSRVFEFVGDAEGNADVINETGVSINGNDYAGFHTFNADGSVVTYGDFSNSGSPHVTTTIATRNTTTGDLLWNLELASIFRQLSYGDDRLFVSFPADESAMVSVGDSTTGLVTVHSIEDGSEIVRVQTSLDLVYIGD